MKIKAYVPDSFPILKIGEVIPINISSEDLLLGDAKLIDIMDSYYVFDLDLPQGIDLGLYPSVHQSSSNNIIDGPPFLSLSSNSNGGLSKSLQEQINS